MAHRQIRGRILYTSKKPEILDKKRGEEHFIFVHHENGRRTLTAHCEIHEPEPVVIRDVVHSFDAANRPLDAFVRLTVGGSFMGAGFFRMFGETIECESYGPAIGRVSQTFDTEGPYAWFGTHPLSADAFNTLNFDRSQGPAKRRMRSFLSSLDHRGASPPMISTHHIFLKYLGDEKITVTAGTFQTRHFQFVGESEDPDGHPPYDLWVTADDDSILVLAQVTGYMKTHYELIELERD